ncbi:uncharacterized protein LOC119189940 [Manduca sexta]|uniref:uncharacterized protein LOC119189940 n=1 Tax=Manduca sexta TaxID=7130 RepID=UPI00188E9E13|nr:uncharacterized protein LOC119189940 [Manduca sexta]
MAAIASVRQKKLRSSKEKAAQEAAASIMAAAAATFLESEPESGNEGMRADIARLSTEVERLSRENAELKSSRASALVQSSRPEETPPEVSAVQPADRQQLLSLIREGIRQEIGALSARFAVLEGIVLRPPLAGSKKAASYAAAAAPQPTPGTSGLTSQSSGPSTRPTKPSSPPPPPPPASQRTLAADKPKKAKAARKAAKPAELAETAPPPTLLPADDAGWTVVGAKERPDARSGGRRSGSAPRRERRQYASRPEVRSCSRHTTAGSGKEGRDVRGPPFQGKGLINPAELGIAGGLRLRVTATGARKLELPGASSGPAADALAAKLLAAFDAAEARVSRPVKSVSLRISGLDDSVTVEEVVAAIVGTTGCSAEELKPGAPRPDYAGMLAITVSCPVTAAKVVAEGRRLLVGWVSAQVKLLEPQPLRCYRCQTGHHVGVRCTSEVDRSAFCFRCGQPGHKIGSCIADKPHCLACAAVGKPAEHRAGSRACAAPANTGANAGPRPPLPLPPRLPLALPLLLLERANINHCARAQDLLLQSMARWSINIAVVSEPYFVPPRNDWVEDLSGSVAIIASAAAGTLTHERVKRGQGCVAARFGGIVVVGCYFSPSRTLAEFHNSLRELSDVVVEYGSLPVVVLGTSTPRARLGVPGTRMYGANG